MPPRQSLAARLEDLTAELEALRMFRRQRIITDKRTFEKQRNKLLKAIASVQDDIETERRSREIARQIALRDAERKRKLEAQKQKREIQKIKRTVNVIFDKVMDDPIVNLVDAWKATDRFGAMRVIAYTPPDPSVVNPVITPSVDREIIHTKQSKDFIRQFYEGGSSQADLIINEGDRMLIVLPTNLTAQKIAQAFRDGVDHCVFVPILKKLNESLLNCKSKESAKRYAQRIAKIQDFEELYANGVPEDKMNDVAKASGFKIVIHNILGKEISVFNENGKVGVIKFTNTRPNHLDIGHIALDQDFEKVSEKEIVSRWMAAKRNKEFYMIEGDIKNNTPRRLQLLDKAYRVEDPNEQYFDAMNERIELNKYRFNATKYPEVNDFIKTGRIINAWVCPLSDEKPTGHLDMPKAYTQFKKCQWYSGFLGVIHQWRSGSFDRKFLEDHIGIYQVEMRTSNVLFNKLGISNLFRSGTTHILPSPEILYFMDKGVECKITAGVWGSKFDFDFPDEMLNDRRYCLWSGRLGMERTTRNFSFSSDAEWASHLKEDFGDDCFYWSDKKICSVRVPIKNVMTTHHILAFITSYVRIQMMEAMSKFSTDQLVKVVMDGIYFKGEKPMGLEWFREKEINENNRSGFAWYSNEICNYQFSPMIVAGNTLLTGQGGAGKTYKIMTDTGFNKILFITPQHILGADVKDKYGVGYTTIHKLIGEDCQPYYLEHAYPPVLFVDEITQIESTWIEKVFTMYKDSLIILSGDLNSKGQWFQCRNGRPGMFSSIWKPTGVDVLHIDGDRRSRDDYLRELKLQVRAMMEKCFVDGDSCEDILMKSWAKKNLNRICFSSAIELFKPGDVWIAGTHATSNKLLENGVCSGWYKQGGFVSFEEKEGYTKRGSFTIHSFQGRTLETGKIFISINDLFEYAMLYTAISRAVHFDQLVFVE